MVSFQGTCCAFSKYNKEPQNRRIGSEQESKSKEQGRKELLPSRRLQHLCGWSSIRLRDLLHQLLPALLLPPKVQHKIDVISKMVTSVWTETDQVIQLQPQKFHVWHAELLDCSARACHCPHPAVSKGWTHLYLLKELAQFKTDTEMEFS